MRSDKVFSGTITYLKFATLFGALMCFALMFFKGFDPAHSLDSMIWNDLYKQPRLPEVAMPAFELPFLLFSWLSVLSLLMLYLIAKHALAKKEKWSYWCFAMIGAGWPIGAVAITFHTQAWSYFVSAGMMTVLFFPPLLLLYPFFFRKVPVS